MFRSKIVTATLAWMIFSGQACFADAIYDTGRNNIPTHPRRPAGVQDEFVRGRLVTYTISMSADPERLDVAWLGIKESAPPNRPRRIYALIPVQQLGDQPISCAFEESYNPRTANASKCALDGLIGREVGFLIWPYHFTSPAEFDVYILDAIVGNCSTTRI